MPKKLYHIELKKSEKICLQEYVSQGKKSARAIKRAHILLLSDEQKTDEQIAKVLKISLLTVHRVRKRYNEEGLNSILEEKPFKSYQGQMLRQAIVSWKISQLILTRALSS